MGTELPMYDGEKNPNDRTRIEATVYTRERLKAAKGDGVTYDAFMNWLMDEAAEKYDTGGEPPTVEKLGNSLIARPEQSE